MIVSGSNENEVFEKAPEGNHIARCYSVVNLGLVEVGGQYPGLKHKMRWSFELCEEKMADGRPFSVSEHLTASLSSKATLTSRLISWRGRPFTEDELQGFNLKNVLGVPCLVNVVHNTKGEKTYVNIAGISPLPKSMNAPELQNPHLHWDFGMPKDTLPDWLKLRIGDNPSEQPPEPASITSESDFDDDIPF